MGEPTLTPPFPAFGALAFQDTVDYSDVDNAPAGFSGDYGDLTNTPTLGTAAAGDIGTDVQAYDGDLASIAGLSTTTFGRARLTETFGWVPVSNYTVSNGGLGEASISSSFSACSFIRVRFRGRSLKSTTTTDTLNMTFNSDTGSVYSRNNTAAGTAFVISSSFTASNTNTNRQGSFDLDIDCGQSSYATFRLRHTSPSSTATTAGSTDWPNGLYLSTTAITSIQFSFSGGNIADGSRLIVEVWA